MFPVFPPSLFRGQDPDGPGLGWGPCSFHLLRLPEYRNKAQLEQCLTLALEYGALGLFCRPPCGGRKHQLLMLPAATRIAGRDMQMA
jgi:hypothetical protein